MRYRIKVGGKIFEGEDPRVLLRRAVEAKREVKKDPHKPLAVHFHGYTKSVQKEKSPYFSAH